MAYAQINYRDIQGMNGKYRISQIGCFLTSFCNLLQRLQVDVIAPNTLNTKFVAKQFYIDVDDGIKDDLDFYRITKLYPNVVVDQEGPRTSNMPPHRNAIVRIKAGNNFGTHFCLVDRIENGVVHIVDSYDGKTKKASDYGPIQGWATYKVNKPIGGNSMSKAVIGDEHKYFIRVMSSEVKGWDRHATHRGDFDEKEMRAWKGQPLDKFSQQAWDEGEGYRKKKDQWKAAFDAQPGLIKARDDANKRASQLESQIKLQDDKIKELGRVVEIYQKAGASGGADPQMTQDISAIKAMVEWIKNFLSNIFKAK